jgi:outer membrane lipoprotein SlyB
MRAMKQRSRLIRNPKELTPMKRHIAIAAIASALLAPWTAVQAEGMAFGVVESVREVELRDERLPGVRECRARPETADELVVRLEDGRAVTVLQNTMQRLAPGERVLVLPWREGLRAERS